jgi:hypothetical protein
MTEERKVKHEKEEPEVKTITLFGKSFTFPSVQAPKEDLSKEFEIVTAPKHRLATLDAVKTELDRIGVHFKQEYTLLKNQALFPFDAKTEGATEVLKFPEVLAEQPLVKRKLEDIFGDSVHVTETGQVIGEEGMFFAWIKKPKSLITPAVKKAVKKAAKQSAKTAKKPTGIGTTSHARKDTKHPEKAYSAPIKGIPFFPTKEVKDQLNLIWHKDMTPALNDLYEADLQAKVVTLNDYEQYLNTQSEQYKALKYIDAKKGDPIIDTLYAPSKEITEKGVTKRKEFHVIVDLRSPIQMAVYEKKVPL